MVVWVTKHNRKICSMTIRKSEHESLLIYNKTFAVE